MRPTRTAPLASLVLLCLAAACQPARPAAEPAAAVPGTQADIGAPATGGGAVPVSVLPAGAADAQTRLAASPRHGEWTVIRTSETDSVRAWVVFPERPERAPVVLVVHEIFGLSHWIRAVADQLAADGFIAIAPDLLTMRGIPTAADGAPDPETARAEIRTLRREDIHRDLQAVARYGMALPAALPTYGIIGFCWGGTVAFEHAAERPAPGAAVAFYGTSPDAEMLARIGAPVLGLYGENDARVNATIPAAEAALAGRAAPFETEMYDGAGHGFLRAQDGQDGANLRASRAAWPRTVGWLRHYLEGAVR
jgi:carboxymethylenebutenolidase